LIASQFKLGNLVAIIDRNRQQSFGDTEATIALDPFDDKWLAFGWNVIEIDGHDHIQITQALTEARSRNGSNPTVVICNTIKGKGVSFMENQVVWHYRPPNDEQFSIALAELEA
jgi:transketolase